MQLSTSIRRKVKPLTSTMRKWQRQCRPKEKCSIDVDTTIYVLLTSKIAAVFINPPFLLLGMTRHIFYFAKIGFNQSTKSIVSRFNLILDFWVGIVRFSKRLVSFIIIIIIIKLKKQKNKKTKKNIIKLSCLQIKF